MADAPITAKVVDDATRKAVGSGASYDGLRKKTPGIGKNDDVGKNTGMLTKITAEQLRSHERIRKYAEAVEKSEEQLLVLAKRRQIVLAGQIEATRKGNVEALEHYRKQLQVINEQQKYIENTVKQEAKRKDILESVTDLQKQKLASEKSGLVWSQKQEASLQVHTNKLLQINNALLVRNTIQKTSVRDTLAIKEAQDKILHDVQEQSRIQEAMAKQKAKLKESLGITKRQDPNDETEGMSVGQKLMFGAMGKASQIAAGVVAYEFAKKALRGFADASDLATEAQYNFGTSLSRNQKSVVDYAKRSNQIIMTNTSLALSFVKMGMSAEEASEYLPKLLASSGVAMRAYAKNDMQTIEKMANNAAAFARQTGMSLEDATAFQGQVIAKRGITADEASRDMQNITGSIRGMNDLLDSAGFQGSLLNVGEFAEMIKTASDETESLSFNVSDYSKRLLVAAKNMRVLGLSEKEASKFAAAKMGVYQRKDPFMDMKQGQVIMSQMQARFAKEIKTGDVADLAEKLMKEYDLKDRGQAVSVAGLLVRPESPMAASRIKNLVQDTKIQRESVDSLLRDQFDKLGIKSLNDVYKAQNNPILANMLGAESIEEADQIINRFALDYLATKNPAAFKGSKLFKDSQGIEQALSASAEQAAISKAAAEAGAAGTKENAAINTRRYIESAQAIYNNNPYVATALTGAAVGATGLFGMKKLAGFAGSKIKGLSGMFGRGAQASLPGMLDPAAEALTKSAVKTTEESTAKVAGKSMLKALMKSKAGLAVSGVMGAAGLATGAYKMFGGASSSGDVKQSMDNVVDVTMDNQTSIDKNTDALLANTRAMASGGVGSDILATRSKIYTETTGQNVMNAGFGAGGEAAITYGGKKLVAPLASKAVTALAPEAAAKMAATMGAKTAARAVPFIGSLISGAMTAYTTEGSFGRKLAATVGDVGGGLLGNLATGGIGGGILGGAAGQAGALTLYDKYFEDKYNETPVNTAGALDMISKTVASDSASSIAQRAGTASSNTVPQITGTSFGKLGTIRQDGSVDMVINARVAGFAPAVKQAGTFNLAKETQFSGALR